MGNGGGMVLVGDSAPHLGPSTTFLGTLRGILGSVPLPLFFPVGALLGVGIAIAVVGGFPHGGKAPAASTRTAAARTVSTLTRFAPVVEGAHTLLVSRPALVSDHVTADPPKKHGRKMAAIRLSPSRHPESL